MTIVSHKFFPPDLVPVRRALVSVSDKNGLPILASALCDMGVDILSTGGTAELLRSCEIPVRDVAESTGFKEILGGRVKTLHPCVHAELLASRDDPEHIADMKTHDFSAIDLLIVNFYPFSEACRSGKDYASVVENIDIGGPAMVRSAAKNHAYVAVVTDSEDYPLLLEALTEGKGHLSYALRRHLAAKAFACTAAYDAEVSSWFAEALGLQNPVWRTFSGKLSSAMRYGENPHQSAGLYLTQDPRPGAAKAHQLQGKALSWNNLNDADAAFELVAEFSPARLAAVALIKHANPCGVAQGISPLDAWKKALACDPVSAFGGIVALNCELDAETASEIVKIFVEVIIAPCVSEEARSILSAKKNIRLLVTGDLPDPSDPAVIVRSVAGGILVQSRDHAVIDRMDLKVVTKRMPTESEFEDLLFAYRVVKHVKSNAIVYARDKATVGMGIGQTSRLDAARIGGRKVMEFSRNSGLPEDVCMQCVVASDAFFPFADGLLAAVEVGASAVIQPGQSVRDEEVIAAADAHGIAMIFTGIRHFRH